ncbi:MAG: hypothetical protein OXP71_13745 [Candidatus Poribacteria bacterium]|nr:hypothetical protein [Candidatus Poribacteria bacterium]
MRKTKFLVVTLWLCFQILNPQVSPSQTNPSASTDSSPKDDTLARATLSRPLEPNVKTVNRNRVVRFGDFDLGTTETVDSIVLIGGTAKIRGRVNGNIFVLSGDVEFQDRALLFSVDSQLRKNLENGLILADFRQAFKKNGFSLSESVTVSAANKRSKWMINDEDNRKTYIIRKAADRLEIYDHAQIPGRVTVVLGNILGKMDNDWTAEAYQEINSWRDVLLAIELMMHPQEIWWGTPTQKRFWSALTFLTLTLVHVLIVTTFPRQMDNMSRAISHHPIGSTLLALILLIVVPYLGMMLILSIIGIPLVLLSLSVLLPMAIYGKTAILLSIGKTIFPKRSKIVAVTTGYVIYWMATWIPPIKHFTFIIASVIGIAICLRTAFGQKSIQSRKDPPRPQYTSPKYLYNR